MVDGYGESSVKSLSHILNVQLKKAFLIPIFQIVLFFLWFQISNIVFFVIPPVLMILSHQYASRVTKGVHVVWLLLIVVSFMFSENLV